MRPVTFFSVPKRHRCAVILHGRNGVRRATARPSPFHKTKGGSAMGTQAFRGRRGNARRNRTERVNRTRLRLELLEDRTLLSGGPGALSFQVLATLGDPAPGPGAAGSLSNPV